MVAIVSGNSLGLGLTSGATLGQNGQSGAAQLGNSGQKTYVNVATGNLVVQRQDELLMSLGTDAQVLRTYNSKGLFTDDNGDNWLMGPATRVRLASGVLGAVGSTLIRTAQDGAEAVYKWDAARSSYVSTDGAGAFDVIQVNGVQFVWTDGDTGLVERYDSANNGRIIESLDAASSKKLTFSYNANGMLASVVDGSGETTYYDYDSVNTTQMTQFRTVSAGGITLSRVSYSYDTQGRLSNAIIDLTPEVEGTADNKLYKLAYTYDGNSKRVETVKELNVDNILIASQTFMYVQVTPGDFRVASVTDGMNATTTFTYNTVNRTTAVTDALGLQTVYGYDALGQLTQITSPAVSGVSQVQRFDYNSTTGDLVRSVDAQGRAVDMAYANGNQTLQRDAAGNTVTRTFDVRNQLLTETTYAVADTDGAGAAQPDTPLTTRYVYDGSAGNLLRFVVSPQGRVTEYVYDSLGQRTSALQYQAGVYNVSALGASDVPTLAQMTSWTSALTTKSLALRTDMAYDARGQLASVKNYGSLAADGTGLVASAVSTQYFYDQAGLLLKTITSPNPDSSSSTTTYTYDGMGRQLTRTDALGNTTIFSYSDGTGKVTTTLANGLSTTQIYDLAGRLVSQVQSTSTVADLGTKKYFYDAANRLTMTQDATGVRQWMLYDAAGRKVADIDGDGSLTQYLYNASNQVTQTVAYATAVNVATLVDANGQPTNPALTGLLPTSTPTDQKTWRLYDAAGRLEATIDAKGAVIRQWYDGASRVVRTTQYAALVAVTGLTSAPTLAMLSLVESTTDRSTFSYFDADGLLRGSVDAEGYLTERRYNDAGQMVEQVRYSQRVDLRQVAASLNVTTPGPISAAGNGLPIGVIAQARYIYIRKNDSVAKRLSLAEVKVLDANGVNLALTATVSSSGAYDEAFHRTANAIDGSTATASGIYVSSTNGGGWIQIDLGALRDISQIEITGRSDEFQWQDGEFTLYTSASAMAGQSHAQLENTAGVGLFRESSTNLTTTVNASKPLTTIAVDQVVVKPTIVQARYIYIRKNDGVSERLSLAEVLVFDTQGVNLARTATVTSSGAYNEVTHKAANAIDGSTDMTSASGLYASSTLGGGWIQIDLGALRDISQIEITGRNDDFQYQNGQFTLYTSASSMAGQTHAQLTGMAGVGLVRDNSTNIVLTIKQRSTLGLPALDPLAQVVPVTSGTDIRTKALYNARGQLVAEIDGEGYLTEYLYDSKGRRSQITRYATALTSTVLSGITQATTLASIRPAVTAQDQTSKTTYDTLDRVLTETNFEGTVTQYSYDNVGNLLATTKALGTADARTLTARYDMQGRVVAELTAQGSALLVAGQTQAQIDAIWAQYSVRHTYDAAGRRTSSTDQNSLKTLFFYDVDNRLTHTVNSLGEVVENRYNTLGQLSATIQYGTRIAAASLSALNGGLVTVDLTNAIVLAPAIDRNTSYFYNSTGTLASTVDALGFVKNYVYNTFDAEVSRTEEIVRSGQTTTTTTAYDRRGLVTGQVRDSSGLNASTIFEYDAFGRQTKFTDALGQSKSQRYDRLGRIVSSVDALSASTGFSYDAFGRLTILSNAQGTFTTYAYSDTDRSVTVKTPEKISVKTVHNRHGQTVTVTDGNNVTITTTYDLNGQVLTSSTPVTTPAGVAQNLTSSNAYDNAGRLVRTTDASGTQIDLTYDAANRVLTRIVDSSGLRLQTTYTYDALGQRLSVTESNGVVTEYSYDRAGQLTQVAVNPAGLNLVTRYTYDGRGNTLTVTNPQNVVTQYTFDTAGRRIKEQVDPSGLNITRTYEYDKNDNVTRTVSGDSVVRYTYDAKGQVEFTVSSVGTAGQGAVTQAFYDEDGNRVKQVRYAKTVLITADPSTVVPTAGVDEVYVWAYDKDGREIFVVDPTGGVTEKVLDGNRNAVAIKQYAVALTASQLTSLHSFFSNAAAKVRSYLPATFTAPGRITHQVYDAASRLIYRVDAEGGITQYTYDGAGRETQKTSFARATDPLLLADKALAADVLAKVVVNAANDRTTRTYYDTAGRQRFEVDALGYVTEYRYAANGNTTTLRYAQKPAGLGAASTTATVAAAVASLPANGSNRTTETHLDVAGRVFETVDAMGVVTRLTLDALGRVLTETLAYGRPEQTQTTYVYSAQNLVVSKTVAAGTSAAATTRYAYDALGRLISQTDPNGVALQADNTAWAQAERQRLGYPVNATSLSAAQKTALLNLYTSTYAYDAAGKLIRATNALGGTTSSQYDAFGNAVKVTDPNGNVGYFYYDRLNRVTLQVDPEGYATQTTYWLALSDQVASVRRYATKVSALTTEAAAPTLTAVDAKDGLTTYTYDRLDRVLTTTDRVGTGTATESILYSDAAGNRFNKRVTNKIGGTATFTVDQLGRTTQELLPTGVVNAYQYDSFGNRVQTIEAQGLAEQRITTYRYDNAGRITHRIGQVYTALDVSNPSAPTTQLVVPVEQTVYDALGRVIETRKAANWDGTNGVGGTRTLSYYDAQGRQVALLTADGAYTQYTLDATGNRMIEAAYSTRVALPTTAGGNSPVPVVVEGTDRITYYTYDAVGRQTSIARGAVVYWEPTLQGGELNLTALGPLTVTLKQTVYDAVGNVVRVVDGRGNSVYSYYDKLGRKVFNIDQEGYATAWDYGDFQSNATRETRFATGLLDAQFAAQNDTTAAISRRDPTQLRQVIATTADDRITEYVIDTTGHVLEKRVKNVAYEYVDPNGSVQKGVSDAVTAYTVDGLGHITQIRERVSGTDASNVTNLTEIAYDTLGREIERRAPGYVDSTGVNVRPTTNTEYNGLGGISRVIQRGTLAGTEVDDRITTFQYNRNGDRIGQIDAESNLTVFELDAQGRIARTTLKAVKNADGGSADISTTFLYDGLGRQVQATDTTTVETRKTGYNAFGDITSRGVGDSVLETAEYNTIGKVLRNNSGDGVTKIYLYDRNGNTTREIKPPFQSEGSASQTPVNLATVSIAEAGSNVNLVHTFSVYDRKNQLLKTVEPDIYYLKDDVLVKQAFTQQLSALYGAIQIYNAPGIADGATSGFQSTGITSPGQSTQLGGLTSVDVSNITPGYDPIGNLTTFEQIGPISLAISGVTSVPGYEYLPGSNGSYDKTNVRIAYQIPSGSVRRQFKLVYKNDVWANIFVPWNNQGDGGYFYNAKVHSAGEVAATGWSGDWANIPEGQYALQFEPAPGANIWEVAGDVNAYVEVRPSPWGNENGYYELTKTVSTIGYKKIYLPPLGGVDPRAVSYQVLVNGGYYAPVNPIGATGYYGVDLSALGDGDYSVAIRATTDILGYGLFVGGENLNVQIRQGAGANGFAAISAQWKASIPDVHTRDSVLYFDKFVSGSSAKISVRVYGDNTPYQIIEGAVGGFFNPSTWGLASNTTYEYILTANGQDWLGAFRYENGRVDVSGREMLQAIRGRDTSRLDRGQSISFNLAGTIQNYSKNNKYIVEFEYTSPINGQKYIVPKDISDLNLQPATVTFNFYQDLIGLGASAFKAGSAIYAYRVYQIHSGSVSPREIVGAGSGTIFYGSNSPRSITNAQAIYTPKADIKLPTNTGAPGAITVEFNGANTVFGVGDWRAAYDASSRRLTLDLTAWLLPNTSAKTFIARFSAGTDSYVATVKMNPNGMVTVESISVTTPKTTVDLNISGASAISVLKVARQDVTSLVNFANVDLALISSSGVGKATWNAAAQQQQRGTWRYYYEALNPAGVLVGKGYGTLTVNADGSMTSTPDAPLVKPSIIRFEPPKSSTASFELLVRPKNSTVAYHSFPVNSDFELDTWDLGQVFGVGIVEYEYTFVARGSIGNKVSAGFGTITLNSNGQPSFTLEMERQPTIVKLQSPPGRHVPRLSLMYRVAGSNAAFQPAYSSTDPTNFPARQDLPYIVGVWDAALNATSFSWDASFLAPGTEFVTYEYQMRMQNADGSDYKNEVGDSVTANGEMTLGGNIAGVPLSFQQYVQTFRVDAQITHMQTFNAFGEVVSEYDDRVQERMQQMLDYYRELPEYLQEDSVKYATLNAGAATVRSSYNTLGQLVRKVDPETWSTAENGQHSRITPTSNYGYDLLGRVNTLTDANGNQQRQSFLGSSTDLLTRQWAGDNGLKQFAYDVFGDVRKQTDELGHETLQSYNKLSQLIQVDQLNVGRVHNFTGADGNAVVASTLTDLYAYDMRGQRISHTDALGQISKTYYDSLGRVLMTTTPGGSAVGYSYTALAGGATQRTTTGVDGRNVVDRIDYFGRTYWHQDQGGRQYTYTYGVAGQLASQTSTGGQNIEYIYFANGFIKEARDLANRTLSRYGYDNAGNRTWESYSGLADDNHSPVGSYQNITITYDELNRMAHAKDGSVDVQYEYDAVGNRRAVHATYFDPLTSGTRRRDDMWYRYDAANRFTLTKGSLAGGQIVLGSQGVAIEYNLAGQRTAATYADGHREDYRYSADGYLEDTFINGQLRARRRVDALGRTANYLEYETNGSERQNTRNTFDGDNRLLRSETIEGKTDYFYFNDLGDTSSSAIGKGQLAKTVYAPSAGGSTTTTSYTYSYWDDAKQKTIMVNAGWSPGLSEFTYDQNGFLNKTIDHQGERQFTYYNSANGQVMQRVERSTLSDSSHNGNGAASYTHFYYYAAGRRIGDVTTDPNDNFRKSYAEELAQDLKNPLSNSDRFSYKNFKPVTSADFDQNYEPINSNYPAATATSYTVRAGDTLASIAQSLWGDSAMWYLLAESNGLRAGDTLTAGQTLIVPNKVTNIHNNANTFRPYNAGEVIGRVDPTLPPPPVDDGGCGGFGQIVMVVVAIAATALTAGALGFAAAGFWGSVGIGAASAAVGSIVSQGVGIAIGAQEGFSWKAVGQAALIGGVTGGVAYGVDKVALPAMRASDSAFLRGASQYLSESRNALTAVKAVASTGVNMLAHGDWSWRQIGASAIGGFAGAAVGDTVGGLLGDNPFAQRLAGGLAGGWASSAVMAGNSRFSRADSAVLFANSLGNALGSSLADGGSGANNPSSRDYVNEMDRASDNVYTARQQSDLMRTSGDFARMDRSMPMEEAWTGVGLQLGRAGYGLSPSQSVLRNWSNEITGGIALNGSMAPDNSDLLNVAKVRASNASASAQVATATNSSMSKEQAGAIYMAAGGRGGSFVEQRGAVLTGQALVDQIPTGGYSSAPQRPPQATGFFGKAFDAIDRFQTTNAGMALQGLPPEGFILGGVKTGLNALSRVERIVSEAIDVRGAAGAVDASMNSSTSFNALKMSYASQDAGYISQAAQIKNVETFKTLGVDSAAARNYLRTADGQNFASALWAADPAASSAVINARAMDLISTGSHLPQMEITMSPLVKIVPMGEGVSDYSPFFTSYAELSQARSSGRTVGDFLGIPLKSEAPMYSIYEVTPLQPAGIFKSTIAPTIELNGLIQRSGGGVQYIIPNRNLWSNPKLIGNFSN